MLLGPAELRAVVVDALGLSSQPETIDVHYRNLRDSGHIARSRRGRGAASAGIDDAVRLLIAALGSALVKDSAASVTTFGGLQLVPSSISFRGERGEFTSAWRNWQADHPLPFELVSKHHSLEQAIAATIDRLATGSFFPPEASKLGPNAGFISVRFYQQFQSASLHYGVRGVRRVSQVYGELPARDVRAISDPSNLMIGGMATIRIIDLPALAKIAAAFEVKHSPDGAAEPIRPGGEE